MSQEKLRKGIIKLSVADDWPTARLEWHLYDIWMSDEPDTCLCGHFPINEICVIENRENGNRTDVGNCCVKNFMGINSEVIFASVRKVVADNTASFNQEMIELAYQNKVITDWEWKFYLNIWRKRVLSEKQRQKKLLVNVKILARLKR